MIVQSVGYLPLTHFHRLFNAVVIAFFDSGRPKKDELFFAMKFCYDHKEVLNSIAT